MNSFEVNTLPYIVHTLFTYRTSDRYRGFVIQIKKEPPEERKKYGRNIKQRNTST